MKDSGWPSFSFTDLLRPPDGWRTEHAILTTYSADLVVVVTVLLALTGCDLDYERKGSRVELVKAVEALRGRVRVLAQSGRVMVPSAQRPVLKLLDKFLRTVGADENYGSWHPKVALIRYHRADGPADRQWRVWLGSRNLTRAMNWEAGLVLTSRADGRGRPAPGLAELASELASRAMIPSLPASEVAGELAALTWDCPPGGEVRKVWLLGPGLAGGFPNPPFDPERVFVVSPFLDARTVRAVAGWGGAKTRRTLVSTAVELQRLFREDGEVFAGFDNVLVLTLPDLPAEGVELPGEETPSAAESSESEEVPPAGLHAKLFFAAKGARRHLWLGSANATERGWGGRNYEAVAELSIGRDAADAIEGFVAACERFTPSASSQDTDEDEKTLEQARKLLCGSWSLRQHAGESELEVTASARPPLADPAVRLEVAILGGDWTEWPRDKDSIVLPGVRWWQRADFLQVRLSRGEKMCSWLQVAPCDPPPDDERDRAIIAQYLDPRTFFEWVRSVLADEPARAAGGDWDAEAPELAGEGGGERGDRAAGGLDMMPTVEEILRAWAREPSAFASADEKVRAYLRGLERRAEEGGATGDVAMLQTFRRTWDALASELR